MFGGVMRLLLVLTVLSLAAVAEIKDRIAAVVNGHPITLSVVEERVEPELARAGAGAAGDAQRKGTPKRALTQPSDEQLCATEPSPPGFAVTDNSQRNPVDHARAQNRVDTHQCR